MAGVALLDGSGGGGGGGGRESTESRSVPPGDHHGAAAALAAPEPGCFERVCGQAKADLVGYAKEYRCGKTAPPAEVASFVGALETVRPGPTTAPTTAPPPAHAAAASAPPR